MKKTLFAFVSMILVLCMCMTAFAAADDCCTRVGETVTAMEDGHYNIEFSDGYHGYCIDYGDQEADKDDVFTVAPSKEAINHIKGESVGNELKTLFVKTLQVDPDTLEVTFGDIIKMQQMIWHFTDDFNGWRIDLEFMEEVRKSAAAVTIPDHGYAVQLEDGIRVTLDFHVLKTDKPSYQNYFVYKTAVDIVKPTVTAPEADLHKKIPAGETDTLSVTAKYAKEYQWQVDKGDGNGFSDLPGATEKEYTTEAISAANVGYRYRCIVKNAGGSAISPVFSHSVLKAPVFSTPASDVVKTVALGDAVELIAAASDADSYQWQVDGGDGFEDIEGATDPTYLIPAAAEDDLDCRYRCVATNRAGSAQSAVFSLRKMRPPVVEDPGEEKPIGAQKGEKLTLTVEEEYGESYQWQVDEGDGFQDIEGATEPTFDAPTDETGKAKYRCIVKNELGEAVSPVYVVTVSIKDVPQTGDGSSMGLYLALMLMSAGAFLMMLRKRRA
ncbi:MAG: sortase B protein-sorting domain-containing protein [Clostridiales bacterium]|nr:sortase B protein-sorting domain-containing protein [Clostridiales bacterium]